MIGCLKQFFGARSQSTALAGHGFAWQGRRDILSSANIEMVGMEETDWPERAVGGFTGASGQIMDQRANGLIAAANT